ncbi:serine--tRNA ligase [bacterium]|nr:serine--tRNA ligase [bacterium]
MLDLKFIRKNIEKVKKGLRARGEDISLDELVRLDGERREILVEVEKLKHRRNELSENVGKSKKEGKDVKELIEKMQEEVQRISLMIKEDLGQKLKEIEKKIRDILLMVPNLPDESVPIGKTPEDNKVVREGEPERKKFNFEPREHWEVGESLGILDFSLASRIFGSRFALLKGEGARLERALINFMLDLHTKRGYKEVLPPFMVTGESMTGTGQLPKFAVELYKCRDDDLYLIPTGEVPLTNLHKNQILEEKNLPLNYVAYTPCFRREAGSYGKDTKGLIRNHQFNKVELVKFTKPEDSYEELEVLVSDAEKVLQLLEIPYRVVVLCSGDLGFGAAKTYDLEVWMPGENRWREVSSCSNFTDFQARRIDIKYKKEGTGIQEYVHTLNGSGLAIGRTFAAILENNQTENGTVIVPKVLQPYMNGLETIDRA